MPNKITWASQGMCDVIVLSSLTLCGTKDTIPYDTGLEARIHA